MQRRFVNRPHGELIGISFVKRKIVSLPENDVKHCLRGDTNLSLAIAAISRDSFKVCHEINAAGFRRIFAAFIS